jgi:hypothetical protein
MEKAKENLVIFRVFNTINNMKIAQKLQLHEYRDLLHAKLYTILPSNPTYKDTHPMRFMYSQTLSTTST